MFQRDILVYYGVMFPACFSSGRKNLSKMRSTLYLLVYEMRICFNQPNTVIVQKWLVKR